MMYYRISKNEKNLFFGKKIAQMWAVTLIDVSLTGKAAALIFISGRGSAISSAKEGKSGCIYNLEKS